LSYTMAGHSAHHQEFKASAVFIENVASGLDSAKEAAITAKAAASNALVGLKKRAMGNRLDSEKGRSIPPTLPTAAIKPSLSPAGILRRPKEETPRNLENGPGCAATPRSLRVKFQVDQNADVEGAATPSTSIVEVDGTPRIRRTSSNLSTTSQGPCHMVLLVAPTPKEAGGATPGSSRHISFGV